MQAVQTAIYSNNQNRPSQYQVAASKMDPGHVFDRQFEQRDLLGSFGPAIGVRQPTAWRMGHVVRQMMDPSRSDAGLLQGVVELDEKYVGGIPQPKPGVVHKRGKGTSKQ